MDVAIKFNLIISLNLNCYYLQVCQIKVSLEDTLARVRHNLKELEDKRDRHIATLRNELYDKNKEHLHIWRRDKRSSVEYAEVSV